MTFVDLVFPAFLFIVGMSIPFALGGRLAKGEPIWKTVVHVLTRTLSLLAIGILMVNESPNREALGWSPALWTVLMFVSAMLAFCSFSPGFTTTAKSGKKEVWKTVTVVLRIVGFVGLIWAALVFRGDGGQRILSLNPFSINTSWYGILGLIGWAYLMGAIVFLVFRGNRTALLGCMVLLFCLYPADRTGTFEGFWLADYVGIGGTLGSHAAITVGGLLLASILLAPDLRANSARLNFTLLFIAGCTAAALLLNGLYGVRKNSATLSWCLWACVVTAALWLIFYYVCDVMKTGAVARPLAIAGQNVLLAYLFSEMFPSVLSLLHLRGWYGSLADGHLAAAVARSAGLAVFLLLLTALLNRGGFRLKL